MNLLKKQIQIENNTSNSDAHKYYTKQDKLRDKHLDDQLDSALYVIRKGILDVGINLEIMALSTATGHAGKYNKFIKTVANRVDPRGKIYQDYNAIAFLALQVVFQGMSKQRGNNWTSLAHELAKRIEADHKLRIFEAHEPEYLEKTLKSFEDQMISQYQHKHRVLMMKFNEFNIQYTPWNTHEKLQIANKILGVVIHSLPNILFRNSYKAAGKTVVTIDTTVEADEWFSAFERERGFLNPSHPPLIVQPRNWEKINTSIDGGYYTPRLVDATPFVKIYSEGHKEYVNSFDMKEHITAVNKLQATKWEINKEVQAIQQQMAIQQLGNGIPRYTPTEIPAFPPHLAHLTNEEWTPDQKEEVTIWKGIAKRIHTENRKQKGKFLTYKIIADVARDYKQYDEFYFIYTLCFRGRMYCATTGLSPQGEDIAKGLLHFKENVQYGSTGLFWLAIQGANTYGYDKVSKEDQVDWVYSKEALFRAIAENPIDTRTVWGEADKPWQFLAFVLAWAKTNYGEDASAYGQLPVGLDGSCNGIQHYSALLADTVGGISVNLIDSELPNDIYQKVADNVINKLQNLHTKYAHIWLEAALDRKLTKRPVMTLVYGATRQSCKEYIYEWILDNKQKFNVEDFELFKLALYLTNIVWDAIGEEVVAARETMTWLQIATTQALDEGKKPIKWVSPTGFPVYQNYMKPNIVRVRTMLAGGLDVRVSSHEDSEKINNYRQRLAVAPNFVHSLDSSHMVKTINALPDHYSLAMIHDDFGTHAGRTEVLWKTIRQEFVNMYKNNNYLENWLTDVGIEKDLPEKGNLDISEVLTSTHFFG